MPFSWPRSLAVVLTVTALSGSANSIAQEVKQEFLPSGATRMQGGYRPVRAEMDQKEDIIEKAPADLTNPKFGILEFGDNKWAFILDEVGDGNDTLIVDSNGDKDLTNDKPAEWKANVQGELTMYRGKCEVSIAPDQMGVIEMYRFDPEDTRRPQLKNTLLYYYDFGSKVTLQLDDNEFVIGKVGSFENGEIVALDRNGDGRKSRNYEALTLGEPFNFTGTTYVLGVDDGQLSLTVADTELPMMPMPPDLRVGKPALEFAAKTMAGEELEFPASYKGKVVMLDFWATWCGPCIGEIPNMKDAYATWHDQGFEILGVSFDDANMEEKLQKFREDRELPWPQIYEGKGWDTSLGKQHDVSGIPFVLVVDGDTGKILGTSAQARGEGLTAFIGKQLLKKGKITEEELEAAMESDE